MVLLKSSTHMRQTRLFTLRQRLMVSYFDHQVNLGVTIDQNESQVEKNFTCLILTFLCVKLILIIIILQDYEKKEIEITGKTSF